jgi:flagellar basal body rod protein FlgG
LVTYTGCRLQGYADPELTVIGDLLIDDAGRGSSPAPESVPPHFNIDRFGKLSVAPAGGIWLVRGQVLLQLFQHPERLQPASHSLYRGLEAAGPLGSPARPLQDGAGALVHGALELAQVSEETMEIRRTLNLFQQGQTMVTGSPTDLCILGPGFFVLKRPSDGSLFASRDGRFHVDLDGFLVDYRGLRVQGFNDASLSHQGDLHFDVPPDQTNQFGPVIPWSDRSADVPLTIDAHGTVTQALANGTGVMRGQVLLQAFRDPQALRRVGDRLYSGIDAAAPVFSAGVPNTGGLGALQAGVLEMGICEAPLSLPPARKGLRLSIQCDASLSLQVEASTDLLHWRAVGVAQPDLLGEWEFVDPESEGPALRFYRVVNGTYLP